MQLRKSHLYPWNLAQMRLPHSAPVPFPLMSVENLENRESLESLERQLQWDEIAGVVGRFHDMGSGRLQWLMSAYIIMELALDVLSQFDLPRRVETVVTRVHKAMPDFLEVVHGEMEPSRMLRDLIEELWEANGQLINRSPFENTLSRLVMSVWWGAKIIVPNPIYDRETHEYGQRWYEEHQLHPNQYATTTALVRMFLAVHSSLGSEPAHEIIPLWWNRTFARLAFVQPEEPDASTIRTASSGEEIGLRW